MTIRDVRRPNWPRGLFEDESGVVLIRSSMEAGGPLTALVAKPRSPDDTYPAEILTLLVPTSPAAARAVEREARLLVELRRLGLGRVVLTIPRHVGVRRHEGLPVALSSTLPGQPMSGGSRHWPFAGHGPAQRDFDAAYGWLAQLHEASAGERVPTTWVEEVSKALAERWSRHPSLAAGLARMGLAGDRLHGLRLPQTVVHGDFRFNNILLQDGKVSGVVGWGSGSVEASPLRDLARFGVTYLPPRRLPRLLTSDPWYRSLVRAFVQDGLTGLGVPRELWYPVVVSGVGELAAGTRDVQQATDYLGVLARLPLPS